MRRASKIDSNQKSIVESLRAVGATVQHLHAVGDGCPDILVGFQGKCFTIEIKDGDKSPSRRKLTPDQEVWHSAWRGQVGIAETVDQALRIIGLK